ncbi:MAG: Fe-S cluster assembly ATPase SufC [Aigarchaeota archaeon]|nr:Fe-S cluster assembly ATPase SufC [Aigarchaeota archaeon]MDW8092844.1 Fe-S cluster assembly ATPase SufC [Nitrososphaerota archaeon]
MVSVLEVKDLWVSVEGKEILRGTNLVLKQGEIHALMGPNGSGKSTLAYAIMGHPKYSVERGDILLDGESLLELSPDQRSKKGIFLAFQYPIEISGVTMANFLRRAYLAVRAEGGANSKVSVAEFQSILNRNFQLLKMEPSFSRRYVNEGFSGGEKKRGEIVQLATLRPKIAILDETDSGLDIDSVRIVADAVRDIVQRDGTGVLVITHYARILNYLRPDFVHVMFNGRVVVSGGFELAQELERKGYVDIESKYVLNTKQ